MQSCFQLEHNILLHIQLEIICWYQGNNCHKDNCGKRFSQFHSDRIQVDKALEQLQEWDKNIQLGIECILLSLHSDNFHLDRQLVHLIHQCSYVLPDNLCKQQSFHLSLCIDHLCIKIMKQRCSLSCMQSHQDIQHILIVRQQSTTLLGKQQVPYFCMDSNTLPGKLCNQQHTQS